MRLAYGVADVRAAEDRLMRTVPAGALMARAATGLAHATRLWLSTRGVSINGARVVILTGSGNNGGDALFAGAWLGRRGAKVTAVALTPQLHPEGAAALTGAGGTILAADNQGVEGRLEDADVVLDGIVGIGGSGGLRQPAARLATIARGKIIAVDVPSGVNPDTGVVADPSACVQAELTVTFGVLKPGLLVPPGRQQCGLVHLVDIGLSDQFDVPPAAEVMDLTTARKFVPRPTPGDDKYTRGVVGIVSGSRQYPGAAVLSTGSARYGGVGMVRYAGAAVDAVTQRWPEVVPAYEGPARAGRVQAWGIGPGAGVDDEAHARLVEVLNSDVPVLIDADAITLVAHSEALQEQVRTRSAATVFTPHEGEFARLGGRLDTSGGRIEAVQRLAAELRSVVLLKGSSTVVADPEGGVTVSLSGPAELATAGSGDVLSGLAASMLAAQRHPLIDAQVRHVMAAAAYLHGVAGRMAARGGRPVVSEDVLSEVPEAIALGRAMDGESDEFAN